MKLEQQDIEKMIHNVLLYDFDDKGRLRFRRFTASQMQVYAEQSQGWVVRANASASVTFDFISDTDYIVFRVDLREGSSREFGDFDLYVDGIFREHKRIEESANTLMGFDLPKGEHRITIYFPWTKETAIDEVHITDGAYVKAVEKKGKWLAFGDSITQGYDARLTSLTYINQVAQVLDLEVVNQGIGGYVFDEATLDPSLISYQPDLITVAYGTNDYSKYERKEDYRKAATAYIEKLTCMFPKAVILGIIPFYRGDARTVMRANYREYTLCDARDLLKEIYEKYANTRVVEETRIPRIPEAYVADFLHPNELGFTFIANALKEQMEKYIDCR